MCLAAKNRPKIHKTPMLMFKVIALGGTEPYLAPFLRYGDLLVKNRKFSTPLLI